MRILEEDIKGKAFKLMIDNLDDLWHLYNLVEAHDLVTGETYRRLEKADDKLRADKAVKKKVRLTIEVERMEFHEFSNRLRIHGTIIKGPEDMALRSYHTLNFTVGTLLAIEKPNGWRGHQMEQLQNAVEATDQPQVTIIAIEDDNAVIALLHHYGVRNLATIHSQGMGKLYTNRGSKKGGKKFTEAKKEFFNDIIMQLNQVRPEGSPLILVGPGFTKDEFLKFVKDKNLPDFSNILVETIGQAGMVGVQEALKRGVVKRLVQDSRVAFETELIEQLLEGVAKDSAVVYGLAETGEAVEVGAVKTLLVIDKLIRGKNDELEQLLEKTETIGGSVVLISTVHDAGKQLEALGGIAALLRYKIEN